MWRMSSTDENMTTAPSTASEAALSPASSPASGGQPAKKRGFVGRTMDSLRYSDGFIEVTYFHVMWIFILMSIVGLLVEMLVSWPMDGYVKSRYGLIWGPFSSIYGFGAAIFSVTLNKLDKAPTAVLFAAAGIVGAAFEALSGWALEYFFGIVAWSYIDQPFNLAGYTSLGMAFVWGFAGTIWMHASPYVVRLIDNIPRGWRGWTTVVISVFLAADMATTVVGLDCWFQRQRGVEPQGVVQEYFAEHYDDEFMEERFEVMGMWTVLAQR